MLHCCLPSIYHLRDGTEPLLSLSQTLPLLTSNKPENRATIFRFVAFTYRSAKAHGTDKSTPFVCEGVQLTYVANLVSTMQAHSLGMRLHAVKQTGEKRKGKGKKEKKGIYRDA